MLSEQHGSPDPLYMILHPSGSALLGLEDLDGAPRHLERALNMVAT